MLIDIIFIILVVIAVFKGLRRGLIVGIFSFLSIIIALAAAIKLSAIVAQALGNNINGGKQWLPFLAFALIFIAMVLLIRLGANVIQKTIELAMIGWLNRLGGVIFYVAIYLMVYSIVLFYVSGIGFIKEETIENSVTYSFVQPWGPKAVNAIAAIIPFFRDMFDSLKDFFGDVSSKMETALL